MTTSIRRPAVAVTIALTVALSWFGLAPPPTAVASPAFSSPAAVVVRPVAPLFMDGGRTHTRAEALELARDFDLVIAQPWSLGGHVDAMRAANPDIVVLAYVNAAFSTPAEVDAMPAAWFALDVDGQRTQSVQWGNWMMDIRNPGWQANRVARCGTAIAEGPYDGCFLDMVESGPVFEGFLTSTAIDSGTGQPWTHLDWVETMSGVVDQIRGGNPGALVAGNAFANGTRYATPGFESERFAAHLDGGMAEIWLRAHDDPIAAFPTVERWLASVDMLADAEATGTPVFVTTKIGVPATPAQIERWRRFSFASFLLGTGGGSYHGFMAGDEGEGTTDDISALDLMDIGLPTGPAVDVGGAFRRDFLLARAGEPQLRQIAVVNPTDASVDVALGGSYRTLDGAIVDSITLPPHSGEIAVEPSPLPTPGPQHTCLGEQVTILGTSGPDVISGTPGRDVILGGGGDDRINGLDGDDVLCGGAGDDEIVAGIGNDRLDGGDGADSLFGGLGDDALQGGWGPDEFAGGPGFDSADYSARTGGIVVDIDGVADDGGPGENDRIGYDIEAIIGGSGADRLTGSANPDHLDGGPGPDVLDGRLGDDTLHGAAGDDTMIASAGDDVLIGGPGEDYLAGGDGDDTAEGGDGADTLDGDAGADILVGGPGDDTLRGGDGPDAADGGGGADRVDGGAGDDVISGGDDADVIVGGDGNDTMAGGAGDDALLGNAGDDLLDGGTGNDELRGHLGADDLDGGPGIDRVDYLDRTSGVRVSLDSIADDGEPGEGDNVRYSVENLVGGEGPDVLVGSDLANRINAAGGSDDVSGGGGDDVIEGGWGGDVLRGGLGHDTIYGGGGADDIAGAAGNDLLGGGDGDDAINGDEGDDVVFGANGDDTVRGSGGNDVVMGNAGSDVLFGGDGDDDLFGGPGDDRLRGNAGADLHDGGEGSDLADYADRTVALFLSLDGVANDGEPGEGDDLSPTVNRIVGGLGPDRITGSPQGEWLDGGGGDDLVWGRGGSDVLSGGDGLDSLFGEAGDDTLDGGPSDDLLVGGAGGDVLRGGGGQDRLDGGANADALFGEAGDDTLDGGDDADALDGGVGNDTLVGGWGADSFVGGDGVDLADYSARASRVELRLDGIANDGGAGEGDSLATDIEILVGGSGADLLVGTDGSQELRGLAGVDVLDGGAGDDLVDGGAGDDVLVGDEGRDDLRGGPGADTADYSQRTGALALSLDGIRNDGSVGELDLLRSDVEHLIGGSGPDLLSGNQLPNRLTGGAGDDTIYGNGSDDELFGQLGDDVLHGGAGSDRCATGGGLDQLIACER